MPGVDEKKTLSEVLGESVEGYRRIFDLAPIALGISDSEGNVLAINRAHQKITGYSFEDWRNINITALYEDPVDRNRLLKSVQEKGRVQDWEAKFKRKDGTEFIALMNMEQIEIAGRNVFFTALRDITELKRAQQQLLERDEAIRKLSMPIVEVAEGVILMPLVGILDSARARQLTESVLGRIAGSKVDIVVMDISGIAAIDTKTATHLLRTVQAIRLMGSDIIITGVRSDVALTLVALGIDLSGIVTRSTLKEGLEYAHRNLHLKLIKE